MTDPFKDYVLRLYFGPSRNPRMPGKTYSIEPRFGAGVPWEQAELFALFDLCVTSGELRKTADGGYELNPQAASSTSAANAPGAADDTNTPIPPPLIDG